MFIRGSFPGQKALDNESFLWYNTPQTQEGLGRPDIGDNRIRSGKINPIQIYLMNNTLFPFLARNFGSAQGVCLSLYRSRTVVHRGLGTRQEQRSDHPKEPLKNKTNPKRTQTNPIFWRTNPILSLKMRIFNKFRKTFLCKTNPICYNGPL